MGIASIVDGIACEVEDNCGCDGQAHDDDAAQRAQGEGWWNVVHFQIDL